MPAALLAPPLASPARAQRPEGCFQTPIRSQPTPSQSFNMVPPLTGRRIRLSRLPHLSATRADPGPQVPAYCSPSMLDMLLLRPSHLPCPLLGKFFPQISVDSLPTSFRPLLKYDFARRLLWPAYLSIHSGHPSLPF